MDVFFALLTLVAAGIFLGSVGIVAWARSSPQRRNLVERLRYSVEGSGLLLAASIAIVATLGSLYYSEVANYTPCKLCWYQRMAMYPLAIILPIAAFRNDHAIRRYVLPLVSFGAAISVYHYLLERFPSWESTASCDPLAPCTTLWVWQFHFISIPFMALSGFAAIGMLMYLLPSRTQGETE